ncbi:phosphoribosyltransferase family protein [Actinomadura sp. RB99]|uniref:ComF family protein n=1 Tax=Actinomadura sp. RB99 TaxID=2691577 RepID=UPI001684B87E|nr:phosphoribosyltransferase family protein [Actinomadura sp. RB99]
MSFFGDLIDFLLPEICAGCGGEPGLLCGSCAAPLYGPARPARPAPPGVPPPWTVAAYEGAVQKIFSAYKEHGRTALATPLGEALARAVDAALPDPRAPDPLRQPDSPRGPASLRRSGPPGEPSPPRGPGPPLQPGPPRSASKATTASATSAASASATATATPTEPIPIVWVPSRRGAARRRGHDPMRQAVAVAVQRLRAGGVPVVALGGLRQCRRVADQAGLGAKARRDNLNGALEAVARAPLAGRRVVLVDDVVTTGASLAEAARALREAGADVAAAATVAATPLRREW